MGVEGADEGAFVVVVVDGAWGRLDGAGEGNTGKDRVGGEGGEKGTLDVEAVLDENDGSVAGRNDRRDDISDLRRDVGYVLGGDDDVVVGGSP